MVIGATAYLMATGVRQTAAYYLSVQEAVARSQTSQGPISVRVRGQVEPGTLQVDPVGMTVTFRLGPDDDQAGGGSGVQASVAPGSPRPWLPVTYHGARPDNLQEGKQVIVEGALAPGGNLSARELMVTCPSRYEAEGGQGSEGR